MGTSILIVILTNKIKKQSYVVVTISAVVIPTIGILNYL